MYRYDNFAVDNSGMISDDDALPGQVCSNDSTSYPTITFNQVVKNLLSDIRDATPRTSNFYVAFTRQVSNENATVYAIAQCVKNVSKAICKGFEYCI